jgi:hypothetical protein
VNRQEIKTKDKSLANIFSAYLMRREAMIQRRTRVAGSKNYRAQVSFDAAKVEDKVVYESQKEGEKKKEKTLVRVAANVGSASASMNAKKIVPVVKGSASIAGANAEALEVAKASASLGSASYSSDTGIEDKVKDAVKEAIGNAISGEEQKPIEQTIQEITKAATNKISSVSTSGPNASARIRVAGKTIVRASCDESGSKVENKIPEIIDDAETVLGEVSQITADGSEEPIDVVGENNDFDCVAVLDDAIDMQFFDVDIGKFDLLHNHIQLEPMCFDQDSNERSPA